MLVQQLCWLCELSIKGTDYVLNIRPMCEHIFSCQMWAYFIRHVYNNHKVESTCIIIIRNIFYLNWPRIIIIGNMYTICIRNAYNICKNHVQPV